MRQTAIPKAIVGTWPASTDAAIYRLLQLAACIDLPPERCCELVAQAQALTGWEEVAARAEEHGLSPLLYFHLTRAETEIPRQARRELAGLSLRHRHANEVRTRILGEILALWQAAGMDSRVLKGAALAHILYPEPGLRPMSDLDLLVDAADARRAHGLLGEAGFRTLPGKEEPLPRDHLRAVRTVDGLQVTVEVHPRLHFPRAAFQMTIDRLPPYPFTPGADAPPAHTLRPQEMLLHLCHHLVEHINVASGHRLLWMADVVGLAERFAAEIDWQQVRAAHPVVLNVLAMLHFTLPLSPSLRERAGIGDAPPPRGIGQDFTGWPHASIAAQRAAGKGYGRILCDTFFPPEWWLRLHYGLHPRQALWSYRWLRHPLEIAGWAAQNLAGRAGLAFENPLR